MRAFLDERQSLHDPKSFRKSGPVSENPEQPKRIEVLKQGAQHAGIEFEAPSDFGMGPIAEIHSPQYLAFLQNAFRRMNAADGGEAEVTPSIHPLSRSDGYPASVIGQAGFHQADVSCPIGAHTWTSAYWSAQSALSLAHYMDTGARAGYALCRPPGHHAFGDAAGGFCFLNNAAIAAQACLNQGHRVAILDVDVHHGNGTQGIFYNRSDVFTVSLHADPTRFYPFFWGYAHETGKGAGLGYNLNLPLPRQTGDADYLKALKTALDAIERFAPDLIVVALGLDASIDDPFQGLAITREGFNGIATAISVLNIPLAIIQEGGYLSPELGPNLTSFMAGIST